MFIVLFFGGLGATGQTDSLKRLAGQTHNVQEKINLYHQLSKKYLPVNTDTARMYAKHALSLSKSSGNTSSLLEIYRSLGNIAIKEDSIDKAKEYYLLAYNIGSEQEDKSSQAALTIVLGNIEWVSEHLPAAMTYYLEALRIAEEYQMKDYLPVLHLNIGVINTGIRNYTDALDNFSLALEGFESLGDTFNIGMSYFNMGSIYYELNDTANARFYLEKAKEIYTGIHHYDGLARCYLTIARLQIKKADYSKAIETLEIARELTERKDSHYSAPPGTVLAPVNISLGDCFLALKQYGPAMQHFRLGLTIALSNYRTTDIRDASSGVSRTWEKLGNTDSSFFYYRMYKAYSDSIMNQDNIKQLAYLDARMKYDQQIKEEQQQTRLEAEKRRTNTLIFGLVIAGLILALLLMFLLLKLWRNRLKSGQLEQEKLRNELEMRNKELTTHVMYQVKKNEFILNISKKLQGGIYNLKPENRKLIEEVIHDLEMDSSDDAWKEFEVRFHRVHADFSKKLLEKYPNLSASELRLCAFLRLNMNTKEIAAITYQSTNSIDTTRHRLRQKLGLSKDDNLVGFLNQF